MIKADISDLYNLARKLDNVKKEVNCNNSMSDTAFMLYNNLKDNTPVDTGRLRNGYALLSIEKDHAIISNNVEYL